MKKEMIGQIKDVYGKGENIIGYLKKVGNRIQNSAEDIMVSYDFQAGTYIEGWYKESEKFKAMKQEISSILDIYLEKLPSNGERPRLMEAGIGEGTAMLDILSFSRNKAEKEIYGFDISWSRIKYAKNFLEEKLPGQTIGLFLGNFLSIPVLDNAVEVVYTVHAIEPNGGKEREILEELYRITNKYLILIEPIYEFGNPDAQERMQKHGYVKGLYDTAKGLGYKVLEYRLMDNVESELNPNGVIVIQKDTADKNRVEWIWADPISKKKLDYLSEDSCWCSDSMLMYPVIGSIPCLLEEYSMLATKYGQFYKGQGEG